MTSPASSPSDPVADWWNRVDFTDDGYLKLKQSTDPLFFLNSTLALWEVLHPEKAAANADATKTENTGLQLQRVINLADKILVALRDIVNMEQRKPKEKSENEQKEPNSGDDKAPPSKRKGRRNRNRRNGPSAMEERRSLDPLQRRVGAMNSIRKLVPVLMPMLLHAQRNDKELAMADGTKLQKERACWLLGEHVYSVTTIRVCKNIHKKVLDILAVVLPPDEVERLGRDAKGGDGDFWKSWSRHLHEPRTTTVSVTELNSELAKACDERFLKPLDSHSAQDKEKYQDAVRNLHSELKKHMEQRFPQSRLSVYGSCLSELSLNSSDVDLSLILPRAQELQAQRSSGDLPPPKYEKQMKGLLYQVTRALESNKALFSNLQPVARARVPVVKGTYLNAKNPYTKDGSIDFDICFMNDIAVANSNLLREYSVVDNRVRLLMLTVKKWAKEQGISSAMDNGISSYAWMIMVIFYLQCIDFVPNLQALCQEDDQVDFKSVDDFDTRFLRWDQVEMNKRWKQPEALADVSVTSLFYGFLEFYAKTFPFQDYAISIKRGTVSLPSTVFPRCCLLFYTIEDPFETYDSAKPHDLGVPAHDSGYERISQALRDAEAHLRKALESKSVDAIERLWPKAMAGQPKPGKGRQRGRKQGPNAKKAQGAAKSSEDEKQENAPGEAETKGRQGGRRKQRGRGKRMDQSGDEKHESGTEDEAGKGKRRRGQRGRKQAQSGDEKESGAEAVSGDDAAKTEEAGGQRQGQGKRRQRRNRGKGKPPAPKEDGKEDGTSEEQTGNTQEQQGEGGNKRRPQRRGRGGRNPKKEGQPKKDGDASGGSAAKNAPAEAPAES